MMTLGEWFDRMEKYLLDQRGGRRDHCRPAIQVPLVERIPQSSPLAPEVVHYNSLEGDHLMDVEKDKNIVSNKEKKIKNSPEGDHLMDVKKNKNIVSDKEKKIKKIPEGDHMMDVKKNKTILSDKEKKIKNIPEGDRWMDVNIVSDKDKKIKNIPEGHKEKKIKNIPEGDHLMDVMKNENIVSDKEKKIKNIPEGDHLMDVKENKNIVSNKEKKIKNIPKCDHLNIVSNKEKKIKYNTSQIVDHNTHLQDGQLSNPIDVENFNSGERGRHRSRPIVVDTEDTKEGGQKDPIAVDEIESIIRQNQPILVEDDDDDDDLLRVAIMVSLSDTDVRKGKTTVQAIDSYVDAFDCEYVGESSSSRKREMVDCGICMEEVDKHKMFKIMGCAHRYCASCVSSYIAAKLDDGLVNIGCVDPQCKDGFLVPEECKMILPREVYSRWGDKLCEAMLMEGTKLYCPFKDCSGLLINEGDDNGRAITVSECPHCHRLFCAQCRVPWHADFSCIDYQKLGNDERKAEDLQLMRVAKKCKWQRCPKCKHFVERTEGCMYIRCRCGFGFCYGCGTPMKKELHYCYKCKR